jgi:hypothetical protein
MAGDDVLAVSHPSWVSSFFFLPITAARERMGHTEDAEEAEWAEKIKSKKANLHHSWVEKEHPGCEISGHLLVDRVPVGSAHFVVCSAGDWTLSHAAFFCFRVGTRTGQLSHSSTLPAP